MSAAYEGGALTVGQVLAKIESRLTEIEALAPDRWEAVVHDLVELRDGLNASLPRCSLQEVRRLEQAETRYARLAKPVAERLLALCELRLRGYEQPGEPLKADALERGLGQGRQALENALRLLPACRSEESTRDLQRRLEALAEHIARAQRLQKVHDAVSALWSQTDDVESASPSLAVDYGKQALDKADAALQAGGWEPEAMHALQKLCAQARARYDDLRRRHEIPTTKQRGEELVPLIISFAERAKTNPKQWVSYFVSDEPTADVQPMEVAQAVDIARQRLIRSIWRDKLEEYIRTAEARLREHKPDEAMAALRAWQALPGLYDERVGVDFPRNLSVRIEEVQGRIVPDLAALQQAQKALDLARLERDPLQAYGRWQSARDAYPYLPDLATLRDEIIGRGRGEASRLIAEVEGYFKAEQWGLGASRLQRVSGLLSLDPDLRSEFQDRQNRLQYLYERVSPLLPGSKEPLKLAEQIARLEELEREVAEDYWPGWARLQLKLQELRARNDVQAIQADLAALCNPQASCDALETLYSRCLALRDGPPEGLKPQDQRQLLQMIAVAGAWKGFAQARDELAKASSAASLMGHGDTGATDAPDLKAVREGFEAARQDLAADQAVRDGKLREKLAQLAVNDERIPAILEKLRGSLVTPAPDSLRVALHQVDHWLRQATSYASELLQLRSEIRAMLEQRIEEEISRLISLSRGDWYMTLEVEKVEALLKESALLAPQMAAGDPVTDLAQGPLAAARAHKMEKAASLDVASWKAAWAAWDEAVQRAGTDGALRSYCAQHRRQAHKRSEFLRAQQAPNAEAAEMILRGLCEAAESRNDWQVWFQQGRQCLLLAQGALSQQGGSMEEKATGYLSMARRSLGWAGKLAADSRASPERLAAIPKALAELSLWETLAAAQRSMENALPWTNARLTAARCAEAKARFDEATRKLGGDELGRLLMAFWNTYRDRARSALEAQVKQSSDILERVDGWLGVMILFPQDKAIVARLTSLVVSALHQMQNEINEVQFDYTARSFLARFSRRTQGKPPADQDIATLQLEETRQTLDRVRTLQAVLGVLPGQLEAIKLSPTLLEDAERSLRDWQEQLEGLLRAMEQAVQLAEDGLQVPAQFEVVRYLLRIGGANSPAYPQVSDAFKDRAHPSYRACVAQVEHLMARRRAQEKLSWRIERCLRYECAQRPDELPVDGGDIEERALFAELRQGLQAPVNRRYPIEVALAAIHEMQRGEPDDACLLQAKMVYTDPDSNRRRESLANMAEVIQVKVEQIHTLRRWLSQFTTPARAAALGCPGVADWGEARPRIEAWRDSGPQGLSDAFRECARVRLGEDGLYQGLWPLTRVYDALSAEEMWRQLQPPSAAADAGPSQAATLCAVAQGIDLEREDLRRSLGGQIAECRSLEADISARIERYKQAWDTLTSAYNALMAAKRNWIKGGQWVRFEQAARDFGGICPHYGPFQEALVKAYEHTGLQPPGLKKDPSP